MKRIEQKSEGRILIKAILFDLDGTLSLMDQSEFLRNYLGLLAPRFAHLLPPDRFIKQVSRSINQMIKEPQQGKTNLNNFADDFTKATGLCFTTIWPIFEEFFATDFTTLRVLVKPNPQGKTAVETAILQGYQVAIAANPVMPKTALSERVKWTGLNPDQFAVIPSMEDFHFCKPQTGFFNELAECLHLLPHECLMVGNNPAEDLAGHDLGMKTFLIGGTDERADYSGSAADLITLLLKGNL